MIETFENKETLDDILGFFDSDEIKNKEQTSTELSFLKARAALAVEKKYGLRGEAKRKLAEKVNLSFNSLNQYATVASRIPVELQDTRLSFWLYRQASLTGHASSAQKVIKWALDTYGTENFTSAQYTAKCEALHEIVRNDGSEEEMDRVIETTLLVDKKKDPLKHLFSYLPIIITSPDQIEDCFSELIGKVYEEWYKHAQEGKQLNLRGKVSLDFWQEGDKPNDNL